MTFKEQLRASFKSEETEEWLDVHFTRPIGLVFALMWKRLHVHPNAVTVLSIFLGIAAGWMFYHTDLMHNVWGVVLLVFANFCDSTDGQLARLTGQKTLVGRVLDGFSGDVWFFCIYFAVCMRLMPQNIPFTDIHWGFWIWVLAFFAGILCHTPQSAQSDYYRQIHLFFLKGKEGSELDSYESQRAIYESQPRSALLARAFYYNYANYCKGQEGRSPEFQKLRSTLQKQYGGLAHMPTEQKSAFLAGSRPLMKYTNILTFNVRAICIYVTCLLNCPYVFMLIDIIVLGSIYLYMHRKHEKLCMAINSQLSQNVA